MNTEQAELTPTGTEVARVEDETAVEAAGPNGLTLIERLIDKGDALDIDVVERLVALQERQEERAAERAMAEALAAFQAACPPIPRGGLADTGKYEYTYATYDDVVKIIREPLAANGLSFTHDFGTEDGRIRITCHLQHAAGAVRTSAFTAPADKSGGKNAIQEVGSARSYGKRYTLTDVLGLATEEDTDGVTTEIITAEQAADIDAMIDECQPGTRPKILRWVGVNSVDQIPVRWYRDVVKMVEKARGQS